MHIVFGLFLIYTGIKAATLNDKDDRPDQGMFFVWLTERISCVAYYAAETLFFITVTVFFTLTIVTSIIASRMNTKCVLSPDERRGEMLQRCNDAERADIHDQA